MERPQIASHEAAAVAAADMSMRADDAVSAMQLREVPQRSSLLSWIRCRRWGQMSRRRPS